MQDLNQKWNRIAMSWRNWGFWNRNRKRLGCADGLLAIAVLCSLVSSASGQSNGVVREIYYGLSGSTLLSLSNATSNFQSPPTSNEVVTGLWENPANFGDNYGDRYRAILVPPMTGSYVFWVQGDDSAMLYLSSDKSPNNKVTIAYNHSTALFRAWYVHPTQQSTNIFLEAGKQYYIEAIHASGKGDDAFAVGWKLPNGTVEQPMPTTSLLTFGLPGTTKPVISSQPINLTVIEQSAAIFQVGVSNFDVITYQWQRNSSNVLGANGASLTFPAALTNDSGSYRCVLSNSFGAVTSSVVTLTVTPDTVPPVLTDAANLSSNVVQVIFSEPLDPATGTNKLNYALNGATISSATFGSSTRVILLTVSGMQRDGNYTLTVNNVRDRAAAQNVIAANSQRTFTALLKGIHREIYANLPGSPLAELTNSAVFPNAPAFVEVITNYFETQEYPTNNYGQRLRAQIVPPVTGNYTFWISAHDSATLSLGTSSSASSAQVIASVTLASDVSAAQWGVQPNQSNSVPIALTAGQPYYIEVLMKSGISSQFPADHMSVRWQLPNGTMEEPISVARLTPFGLNLPLITRQPAGTNVIEGSPAIFSVAVSNLDPILYQWQQNGTNIPGATNATYTKTSVLLAEHNSAIRCVVSNFQGTTNSASVTLTVTADITKPAIAGVVNNSSNFLVVTFSEPVDPVTATTLGNYSVPGVTFSAAVLSADGRSVTLTTLSSTPLAFGSNYTLIINGVRDRAATFNTITANSQFTFTVVDFFLQDIGTPTAGLFTPVVNGGNMTAGNGDFSGTNDAFNYAYTLRRGDFDVKVRVAKLDFADTWTVASLMVRSNLVADSPYAAVCATPSIAGAFFQYRTITATVPQGSGFFPVNYPYTWLRLKREGGSGFSGYASIDGQTWTLLGSNTISMTPSVYLGFMVSSRSAVTNATAQFRDFGDNTSSTIGLPPTANEPLGPSSRRTGLAFTELMYHPGPRADGRHIEFVELHNSNPFFEDISGYRITGDVSYTFPPGTILRGGTFLVIARAPADIRTIYGISNVTGPYTNNFSNKSGTVRLRNRQNAILLEMEYDSEAPWPLAPDGTGHSLVLARPSYGEDNPAAWAQSGLIGGSPGTVDGVLVEPVGNVVINEFLGHTDLPEVDYIELYNHSTAAVDLSGCWLSDNPSTNKFRIPNGTTIGPTGFVYFTETTLGFALSSGGEAIYLVNSNRTRVVDAVGFDAQENGVSTGRSPDGAPTFHRLAAKTPGTPNGVLRQENIVINEIMYNPITGDDNDEFVELYNRGPNAVDIGGWRLNKGIDFTFPTNTIITSNGYVVVGKNVAYLRSNYPVNTLNLTNSFGDYSGSLANSGERLTLDMPDTVTSTNASGVWQTNLIHIIVDEVIYGTGGRWGKWSDGGGSSLELIDPRSDNRLPSNWADSDDTAKSVWTTMSVSGTLDHAADPNQWNALQLYLLEAGECLVDNLSVTFPLIAGGANVVTNRDFQSTPALVGWLRQGDHRYSYQENSGDNSTRSLHVVAQDRGDTGANRIYSLLNAEYTTNIAGTPVTGTISARTKWLHGRPEIIFRLRGNHLELAGTMTVPKNLGTPGARNSTYATNAGPALTEIAHAPVVPGPNEPIVVTARVHDPDGVASAQLAYRGNDPFGSTVTVPMLDNGTGGDAVAGDGVYAATIPGQPNDTIMAFYVQATDGLAPAKTTKFPLNANAGTNECVVHIGDEQPISTFASYRFWMTQATREAWETHEEGSSEIYPGTFVYGNHRIIYNAGSHYAGSPAHTKLYNSPMGTNCDYQLLLPADDALLAETSLRLQEPGLVGADRTCQNESLGYWLINQLGQPALNRRPIIVFINGLRRGLIYEDTQRQNSGFIEQWYPDADSDLSDLYRIGFWYEFGDDLTHRNDTGPSLLPFTTTGGAKKLARYRQTFQKRAVKDSPHNYTNLFNLVDMMNTTSTGDDYAAEVFPNLDVVSWTHAFAAERVINNTDLYGARRILSGTEDKPGSQNSFIVKPGGDSWKFLIWDIDAALLGTPVDPLFDFTDPPISNLFLHPFVLRTYWQALEDAANGPLKPENLHPVLDAKYAAFQAAGIGANSPQSTKNYLDIRRDYILQMLSESQAPFALTSNGGNNFTNASTLVTLTGTAPFAARTITINGVAYSLSWSSVTNWSLRVPLSSQTNLFTIRAYDSKGNLLANSTRTITVFFSGPVARAEDSLVINEIMFQPAVTNAEYVEIYNRSTNTTFGLAGYRLNGVGFDFPPATIINPLSYLMVVNNTAAFQSAYGTSAEIAGEYVNSQLDRDGETLSLVRVATTTNQPDTVISKVKYEIVQPWPASPAATNGGVALQLIDASQDNARVSNWDDASGWKFFSYTGSAPGNTLMFWLSATAEIYIDDIRLVQGSVPGVGVNRVNNGDFETSLSGTWSFSGSPSYLGNTAISSVYAKSGSNSLRLAPTGSAGSSSRNMFQDISGSPTPSGTYTVSFWYKPSSTADLNLTVRLESSSFSPTIGVGAIKATPGAANSIAATVNPYPLLWINEVQPTNASTLLDNTSSYQPWIELYNGSSNTIQLGGLSLSTSYTNLNAWTFPAGTFIGSNQFRVIFVDGRPQFTAGQELHTSIRLDPTNGSIILSRTNQILDYINYPNMAADVSYGDAPDGQLFDRQLFYFVTPGASNNLAPIPVVINEWMASNTNTLQNPANLNKYDDWFELYNAGSSTVDLSGYYLTQDFNNKKMWRIPNGVTIGAHAFLLCWADDNQQGTNMIGNALHVSFKLSKSSDKIGLYNPDGVKVHNVTFGAQTENVSQGLYADGNIGGAFYFMPTATPRTNNVVTNNVYAPVLAAPANRTVNEGAVLTFNSSATDADVPAQPLTYSLANAPEGASISSSGVFTWQPLEIQGPGVYPNITIIVSDNGAPPLTDSKTFQITVNESNSAPTIASIPNQSTYAGTLVSVGIPVSDADLPAQTFTYALVAGPSGASVNSAGTFTWTPSQAQAPSTNSIVVSATDSGTPALSAMQSFTVVVNAGTACGGVKGDVTGSAFSGWGRGNPDGTVTLLDANLIARVVAGLTNLPIDTCEFARMKCGKFNGGYCGNTNDFIGLGDSTEAYRYAAGLDLQFQPLVQNCPPPSGFAPVAPKAKAKSLEVARTLSLTNTTMARGATNCLSFVLNSQGDENALAFSIHFDTNLLTFVSAAQGADTTNAPTFLVNTLDLEQGLVGILFLLPTETSFAAGARVVADICFRAKAGSETVTTPIEFVDSPIRREAVNSFGEDAEADFRDGEVTLVSDTDLVFTGITRSLSGQINLKMVGPAGVWELQRSSNLSNWQPLVRLTNTNGQVEYRDTTAIPQGGTDQHFYRAVKQ